MVALSLAGPAVPCLHCTVALRHNRSKPAHALRAIPTCNIHNFASHTDRHTKAWGRIFNSKRFITHQKTQRLPCLRARLLPACAPIPWPVPCVIQIQSMPRRLGVHFEGSFSHCVCFNLGLFSNGLFVHVSSCSACAAAPPPSYPTQQRIQGLHF